MRRLSTFRSLPTGYFQQRLTLACPTRWNGWWGMLISARRILQGELPDYTCLLGTMVQETYETHPEIRKACDRYICAHAATLVPDIEAAIRKYGIQPAWTAESLAYHIQAVIQGAFILAKARQSAQVAMFAWITCGVM